MSKLIRINNHFKEADAQRTNHCPHCNKDINKDEKLIKLYTRKQPKSGTAYHIDCFYDNNINRKIVFNHENDMNSNHCKNGVLQITTKSFITAVTYRNDYVIDGYTKVGDTYIITMQFTNGYEVSKLVKSALANQCRVSLNCFDIKSKAEFDALVY